MLPGVGRIGQHGPAEGVGVPVGFVALLGVAASGNPINLRVTTSTGSSTLALGRSSNG